MKKSEDQINKTNSMFLKKLLKKTNINSEKQQKSNQNQDSNHLKNQLQKKNYLPIHYFKQSQTHQHLNKNIKENDMKKQQQKEQCLSFDNIKKIYIKKKDLVINELVENQRLQASAQKYIDKNDYGKSLSPFLIECQPQKERELLELMTQNKIQSQREEQIECLKKENTKLKKKMEQNEKESKQLIEQMQNKINYYKQELQMKFTINQQSSIDKEKNYRHILAKQQEKINQLIIENDRIYNLILSHQQKHTLREYCFQQQKEKNQFLQLSLKNIQVKYKKIQQAYFLNQREFLNLSLIYDELINKFQTEKTLYQMSTQTQRQRYNEQLQEKDNQISRLAYRISILQRIQNRQSYNVTLEAMLTEIKLLKQQNQSLKNLIQTQKNQQNFSKEKNLNQINILNSRIIQLKGKKNELQVKALINESNEKRKNQIKQKLTLRSMINQYYYNGKTNQTNILELYEEKYDDNKYNEQRQYSSDQLRKFKMLLRKTQTTFSNPQQFKNNNGFEVQQHQSLVSQKKYSNQSFPFKNISKRQNQNLFKCIQYQKKQLINSEQYKFTQIQYPSPRQIKQSFNKKSKHQQQRKKSQEDDKQMLKIKKSKINLTIHDLQLKIKNIKKYNQFEQNQTYLSMVQTERYFQKLNQDSLNDSEDLISPLSLRIKNTKNHRKNNSNTPLYSDRL